MSLIMNSLWSYGLSESLTSYGHGFSHIYPIIASLYQSIIVHQVHYLWIRCSTGKYSRSSIVWHLYVTGFWKTDRIVTLGLFHFIGPANGYTHTLHIHTAIIRLGRLVCFSRATFADPVNSWLGQWDPWRALHGRHGCEIHPSDGGDVYYAIQACLGLWLALLGLIASPNGPNGWFGPPPASHPPPPPTPITCHQWY